MPAMIQTHPAIKSRVRRFTLNSIIRYFSLCSACHSYVGGYSCDPCQTVCPYRNACLYPDPDVSCQICPYRAYSCDDRNRDGLPDGSDDRICRASTAHCHDVDGHCYDVVEDDHIYRDTIAVVETVKPSIVRIFPLAMPIMIFITIARIGRTVVRIMRIIVPTSPVMNACRCLTDETHIQTKLRRRRIRCNFRSRSIRNLYIFRAD